MSGFKITLDGAERLQQFLDINSFKNQVQGELNAFGLDVVRDAKQAAPTDEGRLKNAISYKPIDLGVEITVGVDYAAYVEFGTRKYAAQYVSTLPAEWKTFAQQYKGGSGSFEEMVKRLTNWVHRKGIAGTYSVKTKRRTGGKATIAKQDRQLAYAIAIKILREGIKPQPFLYPAVEKNRLLLIKNFNPFKK